MVLTAVQTAAHVLMVHCNNNAHTSSPHSIHNAHSETGQNLGQQIWTSRTEGTLKGMLGLKALRMTFWKMFSYGYFSGNKSPAERL